MQKANAVFLDRDGTLNRSIGKRPPNTPDELEMLPGAAEAVAQLHASGFKIFVVTNQGGVGLGYMTKKELDAIHDRLREEIEQAGGKIDAIAACTHKPWAKCGCRKPKPGMILQLAKEYNIDLAVSFMIGDREMDIQAGQAAGTTTILVGDEDISPTVPDHKVRDLAAAAELILSFDPS